MRNFLCSRVIWGDTDVHATAHAPVITKISDNTTSLNTNLFIFLGLIQERETMCQDRNLSNSAHCDPSRGKAVLTPYFPFSTLMLKKRVQNNNLPFLVGLQVAWGNTWARRVKGYWGWEGLMSQSWGTAQTSVPVCQGCAQRGPWPLACPSRAAHWPGVCWQLLLCPLNNISLYNHQLCRGLPKQQNGWSQCFHILQKKKQGRLA